MENTLQMFLPICVELEYDVFFNIIKNAYGRLKLDSHYIDNAVKSAMSGEMFIIKSEDLTINWLQRKSVDDQIRHSKLLGYWASNNFPALGKKFFGASWRSPQRCALKIDGQANEITPKGIDTIVQKKLNLRLVELDATPSTLQKMRHFVVDVPTGMPKQNESRLSAKAKSFQIDDEYSEICWNALKQGEQSSKSISGVKRQPLPNNNDQPNNHNPRIDSESIQAPKRIRVETHTLTTSEPSNCSHLGNRPRRGHSMDNVTTSSVIDRDETIQRIMLQPREQLTFESLQGILVLMQRDIKNLTEWMNPAHDGEDGPQRAYLKIIADKDIAVAALKESNDQLQKDVQSLKNQNAKLNDQAEKNAGLINSLQKGVDANFTLYSKSEAHSTTLMHSIAVKDQVISNKQEEVENSKILINTLQAQLNSMNNDAPVAVSAVNIETLKSMEQELTDLNAKKLTSDRLCQDWKKYSEGKDEEINEAKRTETKLKGELESLERALKETNAKNAELNNVLKDWKQYEARKEKELEDSKRGADDLKREIENLNFNTENISLQMKNSIESLEQELTDLNANKLTSDRLCQDWKKYSEGKDEEINEAKRTETKLKGELESLERALKETNAKNAELNNVLKDWKQYEARKEKELEDSKRGADDLKREIENLNFNTENIVLQLQNGIGFLERELIEKNELLERMGNQLKSCGKTGTEFGEASELNNLDFSASKQKIGIVETMAKMTDGRMDDDKSIDLSAKQLPYVDPETIFFVDDMLPSYQNQFSVDKAGEKVLQNDRAKDTCISEVEPLISIPGSSSPDGLSHDNPISSFIDEVANFERNVEEEEEKVDHRNAEEEEEEEVDHRNVEEVEEEEDHRSESQVFETDDEIVRACRPNLMKQRFGWIRFNSNKNCRAYPGFVYQNDEDGYVRAQKITPDGYVSIAKNIFSRFEENLSENEKGRAQVNALNKFNEKFHFNFS